MDRADGARHVRQHAGRRGVDDDAAVGRPAPDPALGDVGGDDDGDDAAVGRTARAAVRRGAAYAKCRVSRTADIRPRGRLPAGVGAVQRRGHGAAARPVSRARSHADDGTGDAMAGGGNPGSGRTLPVLATQGRVPARLPIAARPPAAALGRRRHRVGLSTGPRSRRSLRWVLLGDDAAALCGGRDEPGGDRLPDSMGGGGEGRSVRRPYAEGHRCRPAGARGVGGGDGPRRSATQTARIGRCSCRWCRSTKGPAPTRGCARRARGRRCWRPDARCWTAGAAARRD